MAKIEISERDKVMLENIPKLLKDAKFELTGELLIPAGQTLSYVGSLIKKMDEALEVEKQKAEIKKTKEEAKAEEPVEVKAEKPKRGRPKKKAE